MSYRAFKHLLGETSLERKCRWLLGAGVLLLMTGSFWVYAKQTEDLARDLEEVLQRHGVSIHTNGASAQPNGRRPRRDRATTEE